MWPWGTKTSTTQKHGHGVPKWAEGLTASELHTQHPEARQRYDDLQMKLIHARVVRITNTAALESDETINDGPSGQDPN